MAVLSRGAQPLSEDVESGSPGRISPIRIEGQSLVIVETRGQSSPNAEENVKLLFEF